MASDGDDTMLHKAQSRPDLLLLLSLLLVILMYPAMNHGEVRRLILGALMFVPVILATVRLAEIKRRVWPAVLLMSATLAFAVASTFYPTKIRHRNQVGIAGCIFCPHGGRTLLLPQECPLCQRCPSHYRGQYLSAAGNAVVRSLQRH